ncbi:hemolymph trypsin inhibitor B-like isoform X1 [Manduca sexta]|uniref:BPTI/Kunitz inhibitor domain-containing protein n=1 Tax=Manduca sexta TaxID=7130 RepID=A0A921YUA4_MANSE|nr:hemolymph trypsin inhibitor B-like isoform X1 [Manduca sexta]KAG6445179.1 hypothetical protein O3G_MSEX003774 [Manduca sexta]KAG6445180.1 hypothetical protein O3G_MSEX003774 [Manduca sexta]
MTKVLAFIFIAAVICSGLTGAEDICSLPPEVGPCRAGFRKFAYYSELNKCKLFTYGGCQGNENNFETLQACEQACVKK